MSEMVYMLSVFKRVGEKGSKIAVPYVEKACYVI